MYLLYPSQFVSDRVCQDNRVCAASEWEAQAPTGSSDRLCQPLTLCQRQSEFELSPPAQDGNGNFVSDRVCRSVSNCTANEFETKAPTATSDRECQALRPPCTLDCEYEERAPSATSDRLCIQLSLCDITEYSFVSPTATSDRQCRPISQCNPGEFEKLAPRLENVTECSINYTMIVSDRVCSTINGCAECEYEAQSPSETSDRVCLRHTECDPTEAFVVKDPTQTSDRECQPLTPCGSNAYSLGPVTTQVTTCNFTLTVAISDNRCQALSTCDPLCQYEAAAPTVSSDRECRHHTPCSESEYEVAQPSSTSDAVCDQLRVCGLAECALEAPELRTQRDAHEREHATTI